MIIVLIRRSVRPEKEQEFLESYNREKPKNSDFVEETLTKVDMSSSLPEALRSFPIASENCVTYVNIAKWKSAKAFAEHFKPSTTHDPAIETSDRLRVVLEVIEPN